MKLFKQNIDNDWQDLTIHVVGLWLFISPFVLQYISTSPNAAIASFLIGVLMALISMTGLSTHQFWEEWTNLVLAAFLIASPWVLGFTEMPLVMWNAIIAGGIVAICAIWTLIQGFEPHDSGYPSGAGKIA